MQVSLCSGIFEDTAYCYEVCTFCPGLFLMVWTGPPYFQLGLQDKITRGETTSEAHANTHNLQLHLQTFILCA